MRTIINNKNFFDLGITRKYFAHFLPKSKELQIINIDNPNMPQQVEIKKLRSPQLKIDSKTSVIQRPENIVYFTGGSDENKSKVHNYVRLYLDSRLIGTI